MKIKARIQYVPRLIQHIAIQCPYCQRWFSAGDITSTEIRDSADAVCAAYSCPVCEKGFTAFPDGELDVEEGNVRTVYRDVVRRKEVWE